MFDQTQLLANCHHYCYMRVAVAVRAVSAVTPLLCVRLAGVGKKHKFAATGFRVRVLRIDTGRGTHRGPVLQRTVRSLLKQSRFNFETRPHPHEGVFLVDPLSGDLDALDAAVVPDA